MTQREKILAGLTIGVVVLVVGLLGFQQVLRGFDQKQKLIEGLQSQISKKNDSIFEGQIASKKLNQIKSKSLPLSKELAKQAYGDWLFNLAQKCGYEEINVTPQGDLPLEGAFRRQKFIFSGKGNIRQFVELLYGVYEKDYLHRVQAIRWTPGTKPYEIATTIELEALSLAIADADQPAPNTKSNRLSMSLADYKKSIVERNLFSEPNLPPEFARQGKTETVLGDRMSYEVSAKDPESLKIEYDLQGEVPEGMKIDKASGRLTWNPKELGSVEVLVAASDAGIPTRTSLQKLKIDVVAPKPVATPAPEKNFDVASQSQVTAFLASGNQPEFWIHSKTDSKVYHLKIGDELKLGSVTGKVISIGVTYAELETEGRRWTVGQDETLAEAFKRGNID
jgi:hypothetical protein